MVTQMHQLETEAALVKRSSIELQNKADELRQKILESLEASGVHSFKGSVGSVNIAERFAVKLPADPEVKQELKDYLIAHGNFDALWTINYQSLNGWYKAEMEAAKANNVYLDIPGLEPKSDKYLQFRKA